MTFNDLRYIVVIAEENSITKAADKLYMTQPALSQYLKKVEKELGVLIFERTTTGVRPTAEGVQLDHHADPAKSRGQYLPLLELSVAEAPEDDRNTHYLGREYLFYGRWDDCIRTLERHLSLPTAVWADERCASMRFLARAWRQKGRPEQARWWLWRAIGEAPHLREPYLELARLLYEEAEWDGVVYLCRQALAITDRPQTYICEAEAWGSLPWDLLSLGLYHTGRRGEALEAARQALALAPEDGRIRDNVAFLAG